MGLHHEEYPKAPPERFKELLILLYEVVTDLMNKAKGAAAQAATAEGAREVWMTRIDLNKTFAGLLTIAIDHIMQRETEKGSPVGVPQDKTDVLPTEYDLTNILGMVKNCVLREFQDVGDRAGVNVINSKKTTFEELNLQEWQDYNKTKVEDLVAAANAMSMGAPNSPIVTEQDTEVDMTSVDLAQIPTLSALIHKLNELANHALQQAEMDSENSVPKKMMGTGEVHLTGHMARALAAGGLEHQNRLITMYTKSDRYRTREGTNMNSVLKQTYGDPTQKFGQNFPTSEDLANPHFQEDQFRTSSGELWEEVRRAFRNHIKLNTNVFAHEMESNTATDQDNEKAQDNNNDEEKNDQGEYVQETEASRSSDWVAGYMKSNSTMDKAYAYAAFLGYLKRTPTEASMQTVNLQPITTADEVIEDAVRWMSGMMSTPELKIVATPRGRTALAMAQWHNTGPHRMNNTDQNTCLDNMLQAAQGKKVIKLIKKQSRDMMGRSVLMYLTRSASKKHYQKNMLQPETVHDVFKVVATKISNDYDRQNTGDLSGLGAGYLNTSVQMFAQLKASCPNADLCHLDTYLSPEYAITRELNGVAVVSNETFPPALWKVLFD
jgi:hypothetical protein